MSVTKELRTAGPALRRTVQAVRPHLRPHRKLVAGGLFAMLAQVGFRLLEPWPIKVVVDAITEPGASVNRPTILLMAAMGLLVIVAAAGRALSNYGSTVAFALAGTRAATSIRAQVFEHVQRLSLKQHGKLRTGDLVQRMIGDVGRLQEVAVMAGLPLVGNIMTFIAMVGVMLWLDPLLTLGALLATITFLLMSRRRTREITQAARSTRKSEGDLATQVAETVGALPVVQAFQLEDETKRAFKVANKKSLKEGVRARRLAAGLERRTDVIVAGATATVLSVGGWRVLSGVLSVGELVVFLTYMKASMKPLRDLAKYTGRIAKAAASGERVTELLDTVPEIVDRPGATPATSLRGGIRMTNVHLTYQLGSWALHDVSLDIAPGETVALIGPSGGGKSSLASLLLRLIEPTRGTIHYDDRDATELTVRSIREQVSVVLQEPVLFATSIRENIRYGRLDASDPEIEEAARQANAHDFIRAMPGGYEHVLEERGSSLSGGQRQRIALARAMLRDAPIVVLDEATSSIDPENEREIRDAVNRLTADRTTIVITHDRTGLVDCDRVLWVEDGHVTEHHLPEEEPTLVAG
ncbi:MAG: ABC transporter ATP-binding protein/permease [Intrasporangiaceae bacterium]|nr:ABC transporter ATP-binding protein/permease [Intrasporangiaceae bacterium]